MAANIQRDAPPPLRGAGPYAAASDPLVWATPAWPALTLLRPDAPVTPVRAGVRCEAPVTRAHAVVRPAAPAGGVPCSADVLPEVVVEVVFEVWDVVRALAPLQGAWFLVGPGQVGAAVATMTAWASAPCSKTRLRRRWPELVPGHAAMDRLVRAMVDMIC